MRGVELVDVDIDGELVNVTINGVEICRSSRPSSTGAPRAGEDAPDDPDGFREAWDIVERLWAGPSSVPDD